jgi:dimethylargininase
LQRSVLLAPRTPLDNPISVEIGRQVLAWAGFSQPFLKDRCSYIHPGLRRLGLPLGVASALRCIAVFTKAIVRAPAPNFAEGLTTAYLGAPDYTRALTQHEAYCAALERCGLTVIRLKADPLHPDSTFVEDTAVLTAQGAILARPGAPSRAHEVTSIKKVLTESYPSMLSIESPGTLDGGDVCEAGEHFFIGISERTNETGARQLAETLASFGSTSSLVEIRGVPGVLHLKSGIAYLGDGRLAVIDALAKRKEFADFDLTRLDRGESYAANCVRVNDYVLVAAGYPLFESKLRDLGYQTIALEMSEFQKMDGGLSCLSLRF